MAFYWKTMITVLFWKTRKLARGKPSHHAYLWKIPRWLRGRLWWHRMAARVASCKGSNSVLVSTSEMRPEGGSFSLSQYLYVSLWQCTWKGFFSEQKNRDLRHHPRDWGRELFTYISKDCTLKSHTQLCKSLYYSIHQASVSHCLFVSVLKAFLKINLQIPH